MKKHIYKNIFLVAVFVIAFFTLAQRASADSYSYTCSDGGTMTTVTNTSQNASYNVSEPIYINTYVASSCGTRSVVVTAQNSGEGVTTALSYATIGPTGQYPSGGQNSVYTTPAVPGSYSIHFVTDVTEPSDMLVMGNGAGGTYGECWNNPNTYDSWNAVNYILKDQWGNTISALYDITINYRKYDSNLGDVYGSMLMAAGRSDIWIYDAGYVDCWGNWANFMGIESAYYSNGVPVIF